MKQSRSKYLPRAKTQKGVFAIELAFVLIGICAIYLFATDLSQQLLVRAKLDRSSFALVNVIKERSRYFGADVAARSNLQVTAQDLSDLTAAASRMLNNSAEDVALQIESYVTDQGLVTLKSDKFTSLGCQTDTLSDYQNLIPVEKGVSYPLYRVTLCEEHHSWFEAFSAGGSTDMRLTSSSIMPGR
ncbi:membrane associated secretion system protein [Vibrio sp. SCSIO 43140]|uniref:tight adherence pilus pseudopilin TadF n=1 Tax=Vibrio sp. SCSIO 43140 TaxID=2819100 RepID=UPI002074E6B8|nr:tight adherence pilus pseudopilin TadF [Vibrio sp. SCSIO 43140]USD61765.1 membrane associated secretion system protein [Vibrio sp. SCSIO 43140]